MPDSGPTRRAVLAGSALLAVSACSSSGASKAGRPTNQPRGRRLSRGTRAPVPATAADWKALGRSLTGRLIRPGDPSYRQAHELYDPRFDHVRPAAVVQAAAPDDVSHAVSFATAHGLPLHLRAGGHSYLGASTGRGLVIDLRPLSEIQVPAARGGTGDPRTATFGAGVQLVDAYGTLAAHGVSIPAGSCPTVGLTGLTLGGG